MTKTQTPTAARYYVARRNGGIARFASLREAKTHADTLHSLGVVAPLVVVATDRQVALDKARRCYAGEITTRQARSQ